MANQLELSAVLLAGAWRHMVQSALHRKADGGFCAAWMRLQLNNIFTINPTTVVTVRYGFNRFPNFDYNSSQGFNIGGLGFSPQYAGSDQRRPPPNSRRSI